MESDAGSFASGLGMELRAPAIRLHGGSVAAGSAAAIGDIILGQPGVSASGATQIDGVAMAASGGIGVFSSGQDVSVRGASIAAGQNVLIQAARFPAAQRRSGGLPHRGCVGRRAGRSVRRPAQQRQPDPRHQAHRRRQRVGRSGYPGCRRIVHQ
ncbi:MAG: hypothetical protein MZW92_01485 [Comamonadaceae bacterium]|nr:hypothetical protein [Comamonadaceae bacterium]